MKRFRLALAALLAAAVATSVSAEDAAARGKRLFEEKKCKMCHNLGGVGNQKGASLDEVGSKHTADALKMWLTQPKEMAQKAGSTRKPQMLSFAALPPADIDALVAFLSSLQKKSGQ